MKVNRSMFIVGVLHFVAGIVGIIIHMDMLILTGFFFGLLWIMVSYITAYTKSKQEAELK